jgi:NAD(P)-dependent dehydrogenase (short-subunit alcohol dehydrogenase family)
MALAKELGPRGIRINLVALGVLDAGLSRELSPELLEDYKQFSALRRLGTPREAARAVLWLALHNRYMNGKVLAVNGGI